MQKVFTDFGSATDGSRPQAPGADKPVIGLSVNIDGETSKLHRAYIRAVEDAGGIPVMIPASLNADTLRGILETVDGLIMTGGADVAGGYFGEETLDGIADTDDLRDAYDFLLLRLACDRQLPVLGICRGMQVINIAYGGDIWQDIPSQYPTPHLDHKVLSPREKPCHEVSIEPDTVLAAVTGKTSLGVNSRHHQAVRKVADGFRVSALSPDGIVEAIEAYPHKRITGVQWHPENMAAEGGDEDMKALFRFFVSEAGLMRRAKKIHGKYLSVDSHCDTPMLFARHDIDIGRRDPVARVDLVKMQEGRLDASMMVAYIPQGDRDERGHSAAKEEALRLLGLMKKQVEAYRDFVGQATTFAEADRLKTEGRRAIFLGLENGYAIGNNPDNLCTFREMGVVYVTLCHNGANDICDSAVGEPQHGGLSDFGKKVVDQMNRLGIVIDLSHASQTSFYDVLQASRQPVICFHSCARALCDHPRNLTDDQITALSQKGGVVQVCLYGPFLRKDGQAGVTDAVDHIDHIVRVAGIEHAGIGSDFDGGGGIEGCEGSNGIINITVELLRRGYAEKEIGMILGGNLRRVTDAVQSAAEK